MIVVYYRYICFFLVIAMIVAYYRYIGFFSVMAMSNCRLLSIFRVCLSAIAMSINMLVFAVCYRFDKYFMPIPFFNYLSWSYGLALLATFLQIFASVAQVAYVLIVRQEMREPPAPPTVPLAGLLPAKEGGRGPMAIGSHRLDRSTDKI